MIPEFDKLQEAAKDIWIWQSYYNNSFSSELYNLIAKADGQNKAKLARGFPVEVYSYLEWCATKPEVIFFRRYSIEEVLTGEYYLRYVDWEGKWQHDYEPDERADVKKLSKMIHDTKFIKRMGY